MSVDWSTDVHNLDLRERWTEEREREKCVFLGLIRNDLNVAKTKLYIGERERE